jgi:hypothetical protein
VITVTAVGTRLMARRKSEGSGATKV